MKINIFKKGTTTLMSGIETWVVQWTARTGEFYLDTVRRYQAFTNKQEANDFAESIRRAHELIGNSGGDTQVRVYRSSCCGLDDNTDDDGDDYDESWFRC